MRLAFILVVIIMLLIFPMVAEAGTTADVTVTALPQLLCITNAPATFTIGEVNTSSVTWAKGTEPGFPLADANCTYTITNCGMANMDVDISGEDLTGTGGTWALGVAIGADQYALKAGASGVADLGSMVQVSAAGQEIVSNLDYHGGNNTKMWEMAFYAPSAFTFAGNVTGTITLTARSA